MTWNRRRFLRSAAIGVTASVGVVSEMNEYYATDPEWDVKIADRYRQLAGEV